jgi:hypothetical protein
MLTRHPLTVLVACVVAAAGVAAGVTYMLTSRRRGNRAGSPMPMVNASKAKTVIRSATGVSRIDVEQVSAGTQRHSRYADARSRDACVALGPGPAGGGRRPR